MKNLLTLMVLMVLSISFVSGITDYHGQAFAVSETATIPYGAKLEVYDVMNSISLLIADNTDVDTCYLLDSSEVHLENNTITGGSSNFTTPLSSLTTYYVACDKNGASYTTNRTIDGAYPAAGTVFNWTSGWNELQGDHTRIGAIVGITYEVDAASISLNEPENGGDELGSPTIFNATITPNDADLVNATTHIYHSNGTLFGTNFTTLTGSQPSDSIVTLSLPNGDFLWNVEACADDNGTYMCVFGNMNYSFTHGFDTISEVYNLVTTEGTKDLFELNITLEAGTSVSDASLIYNGSFYSGVVSSPQDNNYTIKLDKTAIGVEATSNFTFFWNLELSDGSIFNATQHEQQINNIEIDDCSVQTLRILNYTVFDEGSKSHLLNSTISLDVDISPLGESTPIIEFSQNYSQGHAEVCLSAGSLDSGSYRMDVQTVYEGDNHSREFHHLQNFTLDSDSANENISLYDLLLNDVTKFIINFKDASFIPVQDALVDITRKYISEGTFSSVEVSKTDSDGRASASFDTNGVIYTIIISKDGIVLATFDSVTIECQNPTLETCALNLNAFSSSEELQDFTEYGGIVYTMDFDRATRSITVIFTTTDGGSETILVNATVFSPYKNQTACSETMTSSSGTITCTVPTIIGNTTILAELWSGDTFITSGIYNIKEDPPFGEDGVFFAIIMYLTLPLMFISSPVIIIFGALIAVVMAIMMNVIYSASVFGVGATVGWFFVAGAIIIWRISRGSQA